MPPPRLSEVFPAFYQELEHLLLTSKEPELASQLPDLRIARRCRCEDDFCATFYTISEPSHRPWKDAHSLELQPQDGTIIVDVVSGRIAKIEVLFRDDVRSSLRALFP